MKTRNILRMVCILLAAATAFGMDFENGLSKFQQQKEVMAHYFQLKDDLVKTNAEAAAKSAGKLVASLKAAKMEASMIKAAEAIAASKSVESQRISFKVLTDKLVETLKKNGTNQAVYVQYCPMAFNNTGASWLSESKEIFNPYFGDKMLRCGRVKETLGVQ